MSKVWVNINSFSNPFEHIRGSFFLLKPGETMLLTAPHRDMVKVDIGDTYFHVLPDRSEPPNTFSMKQIIEDALNSLCPQVDKDYEELNFAQAGELDDGQGFWKLFDLKIEDGYIHATIKKI